MRGKAAPPARPERAAGSGEPAAGYVGHPAHLDRIAQAGDLACVGAVRLQVDLPERTVEALRRLRVREASCLDYLARERVPVGVEAAGGEAEDGVAGRTRSPLTTSLLARSDARSDDVEIFPGVEARHLRRLTADEGDA